MNTSVFTLGQIPTAPLAPVPPVPSPVPDDEPTPAPIGPMYAMAEKLFILGHNMLHECKDSIHTDYPDMDAYHKDCDIRWKRAIELITMAEKMLKN